MNTATVPDKAALNQQVHVFLTQCGLSQYYPLFIEEGFDRIDSVSIYPKK